jgi:hypothetical protein
MLRGWDSHLVDQRDRVGPIFLEGVDRLDNRRGFVLAGDTIFLLLGYNFLLLGVHPTAFDDLQANVNDVTIIHWVACHACVGCIDEEARCKGLKAIGGMPVGGHPLPIIFAIFGRCFAILCDEPVEHV